MYTEAQLADLVPIPAVDAYKYSRGKAVLVAGSTRYPGAACLAAQASQYAGAGYTQVYTAFPNITILQQARPSLVVSAFGSYDPTRLVDKGKPGAVVMGPGFSSDPELETLVRNTVKRADIPLLIDGGGLTLLLKGKAHTALAKRHARGLPTVLTPHEGEAKRLGEPYSISLNRLSGRSGIDARKAFARSLALCYESIIVLKGADTVIASPDPDHHPTEVVTCGTAALAKAGTGDVLAGLIGGLMAQDMDPFDACVLGVTLHARAGVIASERYGIVSTCAEEVLASLPAAIMQCADSHHE